MHPLLLPLLRRLPTRNPAPGFLPLVAIGIVAVLVSQSSRAADATTPKHFDIVRIMEAEAPKIDGRMNETAWQRAAKVDDMHQYQPNDAAATQKSEFFIMYDKDSLYVGAHLYETDPSKMSVAILRQGERLNYEDKIAVILDTFNDHRNGYRFEVNPNGIRDDALFLETTQLQWEWEGIYQAQAVRTADGWTAEMAIPFKSLSFDPASDTWGINFFRFLGRTSERMGWVSRNRTQNPSTSGTMSGIHDLDQGLGLDVVPSISFRETKEHELGESSTFKVEPSLDVYYKATPSLNASLTFNTDFSATEVDARQVNLDRFSLFFPEKRAFFLRESDIFEFGRIKGGDTSGGGVTNTFSRPSQENGKPFFSRSIGLSATGEPADIVAGAKVAGRVGGFDVGALAIRQDAFGAIDAQNLFVGRAVMNVLGQSSLGLIATSGNPRSNLGNSLVGTDFRYLNNSFAGNHAIEGEMWVQQSTTEGLSGDDMAWGARLRSPNNTGWRGGAGIKSLEANFNPAMGFVNRRGINNYTGEFGYTRRYQAGRIQSMFAGVDVQQTDGIDGGMQSRLITARLFEWQMRTNDQFRLRRHTTTEVLTVPFEISKGIFVPVGTHTFDEYEFDANSASVRPFAFVLNYRGGDFYTGKRWRGTGEAVWKVSPHLWWTANMEYNDVSLPQGDFIVRLLSTRFDVMFNAKWSWVTLIQYDNVSDSIAAHSRVRYIPQAGQELFVVFNHNLLDENEDGTFRSTRADGTVKLNYTYRF